jgi:NAD(P)-dependent dehydrogenase (short-subunit alcohol dehydrogenase family)
VTLTSVSMAGKRVLVTGGTAGIGRATAVALGRLGADVIIVARDPDKAEATLAELRDAGAPSPAALLADLSHLGSVRGLVDDFRRRHDRLDVLVNNAGAIFGQRKTTAEGLEQTFALNHMSAFLLTNLLVEPLAAAPAARVVNVSSELHRASTIDLDDLQLEKSWSPYSAYCATKLYNLLFTFELARRFPKLQSNALHPGIVASSFGRNNGGWLGALFAVGAPFLMTPEKGARTSVWLASSPEVEGKSGGYFKDCRPHETLPTARDVAVSQRLWDESCRLAGVSA